VLAPVGQDGDVGKTSSPAFSPTRLAEARRAAGLSNAQLAEIVGVRRQEVVRWQSRTTPRTPRPQLQLQIAAALGVEVADLVEEEAVTLATLRRALGLRQADLADQADLPRSTLQALETGKIATLRPDHARRLSDALRVSLQEVVQAHSAGVKKLLDHSKEPG
jgi:transcriptional regulator with XRE-family HTH domain